MSLGAIDLAWWSMSGSSWRPSFTVCVAVIGANREQMDQEVGLLQGAFADRRLW